MLAFGSKIDSYEILEVVGSGRMANALKDRHDWLGSLHALMGLVADQQIRQRFLSEGWIESWPRRRNIARMTLDFVNGDPSIRTSRPARGCLKETRSVCFLRRCSTLGSAYWNHPSESTAN